MTLEAIHMAAFVVLLLLFGLATLLAAAPITNSVNNSQLAQYGVRPNALHDGPPSSCTSVATLIRHYFDHLIHLQRHGPPESWCNQFYAKYISNLKHRAGQDPSPCNDHFSDCCLSDEDVQLTSPAGIIESEIAKLKSIDANLFYLDPHHFTLPALETSENAIIETAWNDTMSIISQPRNQISAMPTLPPTLSILYDPNRTAACDEFNQFDTAESGSVPATDFIQHAISLSLQTVLLGVLHSKALQTLHHSVAYVFMGIRCYRLDRDDLQVPTSFYPIYQSSLDHYAAQIPIPTSQVPTISSNTLEKHYSLQTQLLSSYSSWGRLAHLVTDGISTKQESISLTLFNRRLLSDITKFIMENYSISFSTRAFLVRRYTQLSQQSITSRIYQAMASLFPIAITPPPSPAPYPAHLPQLYRTFSGTCASDYYPYPEDPALDEEGCCATICADLQLIVGVGVLTTGDCCALCNQSEGGCEMNQANPLAQLAAVHLVPYGEEEEPSPIPVII